MLDPKFILLDEPVSSLDILVQAGIIKLLKGLRQRTGVTMMFVAHDLSVIKHVCDRVAVMKSGRIVESGGIDQVFSAPQHSYTKLLLESIPVLS
jgi:ABC-type oligopeptide transport system ATPase subunit